tara:strand:- start:273 stop:485 length:213 start_codon:yes stop_codon:yes gene_type:complete
MYKLFAVLCVMANGLDCTLYDDSEKQIFKTLAECDQQAQYRFYGMAELFDAYNIPYQTLEVGCKLEEEES